MAFQLPSTYTAPPATSGNPTFLVNLPSRGTASASKSSKAAPIRYTSNGHRVRVKLPPSPSPSTTRWSLETPEQDEDDDDDLSFVGSESEHLSDENREELSDDGDETRDDNSEELSDEDGEEFSDDDGEEFDDEIPEEEVASLLLEAKELSAPTPIPHIAVASLPGTVAPERDDKDGKETTQANVTEEGETAGKRDDPPAASAPTASRKPPPFTFGNASPIVTTSASQPIPGRGSTLDFAAAWNNNLDLTLPESCQMSLSNNLLFNEVFKIQEIDRKSHPCRGLDAQGAQCKSSVPRCHSLSIKLVENSLGIVDVMKDKEIEYLAVYNMCDDHTKQAAKLAKEWIRLANLTEAARKYWLNQQKSLLVGSQALWKAYAEFAAAEIRRILAQDEIAVRVEKEKTELYNESQKTVNQLRTKIDSIESEVFSAEGLNEPSKKTLTKYLDEISALEKQINNLTTENSSLKEARKSTEDVLAKERERDQRDLLDTKDLYKVSQMTVEALHTEISALTSKVSDLTTENSSLKEGQEAAEDALVKERKLGQQDLQDAKGLYEGSQKTVEALRKEVDALNSCISELATKESSLKNSLESTQDALTKEKVRSRELEIRLEERVALGIKTHDSPETKLEKYLREELDKSQRHVLQQQKDLEKLRDDHVRLQITNATLESQVKQIEATKEDLSRASKREFQELVEKNSDLSNQLYYTKAEFEQLKATVAATEKENEGEASKSKFSLRDIYRRPKHETSRLLTPPTDQ
ncbi:uncharacterized protein BDR25DRAFT_95239 [Lindgomyces ingoldianus]|uniref:Uncharacterized protein n=1 Tax=Lindgomyces ingoldianus TaxID=673940 RepID=A0ACB6QF91_9PLEO|nr:uncharacterized protein BDR25DRAFT_95239 [Lindgomyces ingoldianus]KAF2464782.1 hypothetical protein BDR25DRAFT_95239 [Lindgomyces ingoldianus]